MAMRAARWALLETVADLARGRPHRRAADRRAGRRHAPPFRQGRRPVLRPDLGAAQGRARLDPDAALYWLARMLDGGCDPAYLARRITRMAVEDIGLGDPRALPHGAGSLGGLRTPRQPRRRAGAGAMRGVPGRGAQEQCRLHRASAPRARTWRDTARWTCRPASATRPTPPDEGAGPRRGLPLRA